MSARRALFAVAAALLLACDAQAQPVTEPAVKAAFLYKFLGYVEWPAQEFPAPDSPFVVGVLGADEIAGELERVIAERSVSGRRIVVRRLREGEDRRGLHLLFLGKGANAKDVLRAPLRGTLTVTESEGGLEAGSTVNLVTLEDRVGFEVSLNAAERNGLTISSRMLAVARRVLPKGGG